MKAGIPSNMDYSWTTATTNSAIPFNDSRELMMDILKHGAEAEIKAPEFLRKQAIRQIAAMHEIYKK